MGTYFIAVFVIIIMASKGRTQENTTISDCKASADNEALCAKSDDQMSPSDPGGTVSTDGPRTTTEGAYGASSGEPCGGQLAIYRPVLPVLHQTERNFKFAGHKWTINQQWNNIGLSAVIWEAAITLAEYLEDNGPSLLQGQRVIELGAGTGLVGLVATSLGAERVEITDRKTESAETNLLLNRHNVRGKDVVVRELEWGVTELADFKPPFDVILAADVIYNEDSFAALLQTLWELSSSETVILLSCKKRYDREERFLELAERTEHFSYQVVMQHTKSNSVTLYRLSRIKV